MTYIETALDFAGEIFFFGGLTAALLIYLTNPSFLSTEFGHSLCEFPKYGLYALGFSRLIGLSSEIMKMGDKNQAPNDKLDKK